MSDEPNTVSPFRLAFRAEGDFVNCYLAPPESMEGAELLASMRRSLLDADKALWASYRELMENAARVMAREVLGADVAAFDTTPAPEHEKSGRG
jgi:hypothetical protein